MAQGLQTARALVVDDVYWEAQPVLLALCRLGIGSVYLNGKRELLPEDRFRGIRLAFVDMDLQGDSQASFDELGHQAADYLADALGCESGLLSVLAWTKHAEAAEAFRARLSELLPSSAVLSFGVEEKPQPFPADDADTLDDAVQKIERCVSQGLDRAPAIRLLWEWEQVSHEAVTATTQNLVEVVRRGPPVDLADGQSVSSRLTDALGLLAAAAAERESETHTQVARHAFAALVPILEDRTEQASEQFGSIGEEDLPDLLSAVKKPRDGSDEGRARYGRLNRMVHVSRRQPAGLLPGNVYAIDDRLASVLPFATDDLLSDTAGKDYKEGSGEIEPTFVVAEVTPSCDYAQKGRSLTPRVVAGALLPIDRLKRLNSRFVHVYRHFGVFHFDESEAHSVISGTYHFALNARFLTGVSSHCLEKHTPLFRIRRNTLADVQAWLAGHGNRPGVLTIAL